MADESTYLIRLAAWLGHALGNSAALFAEFSTEDLGLELPNAVIQAPAVTSALTHAETTAKQVDAAATELETAAASGDELQILAGFVKLGLEMGEYCSALDSLVTAVSGNVTAATIPDATARAAAQTFVGTLAKQLSDYVLASVVTDNAPEFAFLLSLAGLLDWQYRPPEAAHDLSRDYVRKTLRLGRIKDLISDPAEHFRQTIRWGDAAFDPAPLFRLAADFFDEEADVEVGTQAGDPFLRIGSFIVRRDSSVAPPGMILALVGELTADKTERTQLGDTWGLGVSSSFRMAGSVSGKVTPPLSFRLQPAAGQISGELRVYFDRNESARPFDLVGGTGLVTVSANNLAAGLGLKAVWNAGDNAAVIAPMLFANVDGLTLKLGASGADSFIGSLLSSADVEGEFDLGLEWEAEDGLRVQASGGVEVALPVHKQLGPVDLQTIYLALRIKSDGTLALEASSALAGKLGPLSASVDRIGAQLELRFADASDAKYGPFDLAFKFKPPNGVGLSVDAGVVKGGGYLYLDYEKGEYAGALELVFSGWINLTAIGLITTKMPDGSTGFSLLIIITAQFGTGFQLGYGFVLLGVGGLLGLNRTMRLQPLMEGVRSGAINGIMFPTDVVANAPRIISDLRTIFPPENGKFLIGPMAKLGWGTPALISISLGIIIEIPGNIAILGVLKVALPAEQAPLLVLQVNFAGAIEFDKHRLYFFASLFESRVIFITIDGEMGLLVAWGGDANFVISVGGFHPLFTPPPLPFPSPKRIAFNILNHDNARIRLMGYFAVTSNTVQFGARAELYFGFSCCNISGFMAFDALIQFDPFYFIVQISAELSLKVFGIGLFSVRLKFSLEGPSRWRARGTFSFSIFWVISIDISFDRSWGETEDTSLPPIEVMPLLEAELKKLSNWSAQAPASASGLLVSLRPLAATTTEVVLHPAGTLRVSQRAVPLDITIAKVGNQKVDDANLFTLSASGDLARLDDATELFAMGQFLELDNAAKLTRKSFDGQHGGLLLSASGDQITSSKMAKRVVRYETVIIDSNYKRLVLHFFTFWKGLFGHFLAGNAAAKSALSAAGKKQFQPFAEKIAVKADLYTVALTSTNGAYRPESAAFESEALAHEYMRAQVRGDPTMAEQLHVIPRAEVNGSI